MKNTILGTLWSQTADEVEKAHKERDEWKQKYNDIIEELKKIIRKYESFIL